MKVRGNRYLHLRWLSLGIGVCSREVTYALRHNKRFGGERNGTGRRKAYRPRIARHEATQRIGAGGDDVESPPQVLVQVGTLGIARQKTWSMAQ